MSGRSPQQPPTSRRVSLDLSVCIVLFRQLNAQRGFLPSQRGRVLRSGLSVAGFDGPGEFQTQLLYRQKHKVICKLHTHQSIHPSAFWAGSCPHSGLSTVHGFGLREEASILREDIQPPQGRAEPRTFLLTPAFLTKTFAAHAV